MMRYILHGPARFKVSQGRLTLRWRRPGMQRDLLAMLYDVDARGAVDGANPGASAQNR